MKTTRRKLQLFLMATITAICISVGYQVIADYLARPPAHQALVIGDPAPDFELPLLQFAGGNDEESVTPSLGESIRLSAHHGEQLVCLFISSFT